MEGTAKRVRRQQATVASTQNVKNEESGNQKKQAFKQREGLERTTFRTSRQMDFFSEKEVTSQIGHGIREWSLVILKELIDNGLDACEEADVAPIIEITADLTSITVADNGPGLPEETLRDALDFTVSTSSRAAYVAPDRGKQGNGLKSILAMPRVIDPQHGTLVLEARGGHIISCGADPVSQTAVFRNDRTEVPTQGTTISVRWSARKDKDGRDVWPFGGIVPMYGKHRHDFHTMVEGFALFNAHATFILNYFGTTSTWPATNTSWPKWKPSQPTSVHWYELSHLERLIGAYVNHDIDAKTNRLVSDFIRQFDGLTGSHKCSKVLDESQLSRVALIKLIVDGKFDRERVTALLESMKRHTRPVKPQRLGIIGEDHFKARLLSMGVQEDSFRYHRMLAKEGLPWILETAFGWLGEDAYEERQIFTGVNWSASIKNPFRSFGARDGGGLEAALANLKAGNKEPIVFAIHLAHPRVEYTDRGKSALIVKGGAE